MNLSAILRCQQWAQPSLTGVQRMAIGFQEWVRYSMLVLFMISFLKPPIPSEHQGS